MNTDDLHEIRTARNDAGKGHIPTINVIAL
jgi:hypothetical protein